MKFVLRLLSDVRKMCNCMMHKLFFLKKKKESQRLSLGGGGLRFITAAGCGVISFS